MRKVTIRKFNKDQHGHYFTKHEQRQHEKEFMKNQHSGFLNFEDGVKEMRKEYHQDNVDVGAAVVRSTSTLWDKQKRNAKYKKGGPVILTTPKGKRSLLKLPRMTF